MKIKFADLITLFSLSLGLSTLFLYPPFLPYIIIICAFLDLLDGYVARLTKTQNTFGMILDEMADIVLFSILPSIVIMNSYPFPIIIPIVIAFALAGILRHARIVDERYKETKGATSTSVAVFIMLLILVKIHLIFMVFLLPLLSYALLSERKYINHKEVERKMGLRSIIFIIIALSILALYPMLIIYTALILLGAYIFFGWLPSVNKP